MFDFKSAETPDEWDVWRKENDVTSDSTGEMDEQEWADHLIGLVVNACRGKIPGVDVWHYGNQMIKIKCNRGSVILRVSNIHRIGG